jgi:hypothetical protein
MGCFWEITMLKSELYKGQIYAGATKLACTLSLVQNGPLQITIGKGVFTHTNGSQFTLNQNEILDFVVDATATKFYQALLVRKGTSVDVALLSRFEGGEYPQLVDGWQLVHPLIFEFALPPGTIDLSGIDIYHLSVLPGFPDGTTATDWQMQRGAV